MTLLWLLIFFCWSALRHALSVPSSFWVCSSFHAFYPGCSPWPRGTSVKDSANSVLYTISLVQRTDCLPYIMRFSSMHPRVCTTTHRTREILYGAVLLHWLHWFDSWSLPSTIWRTQALLKCAVTHIVYTRFLLDMFILPWFSSLAWPHHRGILVKNSANSFLYSFWLA